MQDGSTGLLAVQVCGHEELESEEVGLLSVVGVDVVFEEALSVFDSPFESLLAGALVLSPPLEELEGEDPPLA